MQILNDLELQNINGGSISAGAFFVIGAAIVFIVGIIDGYVRPLKCNK